MIWNTHSYYSLRYGTMSLEKLIETAKKFQLQTLGLTDINTSMGIVDFVKLCKREHIKPLAGIEFRKNNKILYCGLAKNNEGFYQLNEFLTHHNLTKKDFPIEAPPMNDCFFIYPFDSISAKSLKENEFIGISVNDVRKLFSYDFITYPKKIILQQSVTLADQEDFELHVNLRAIDKNTVLSRLHKDDLVSGDQIFYSEKKLRSVFRNYPQIISNTEDVLASCSIDFDFNTAKNKKTFTGEKHSDKLLLEKLALDGLQYRYGKQNKTAKDRLLQELSVIDNLNFSSYFLITWDIIRYSMMRGFYHVGRGSGANSIVAYCLKITDVDPIELGLYFERFINPKRTSPPDFDIDYSWKERSEVQDYIFKRHGSKHTALIGATSTFRQDSAFRELGKAHGLPKSEIDQLVDSPKDFIPFDLIGQKIFDLSKKLKGFPNYRSIHPGGIIISELPLSYYTALDLPPKGFPTTQWDMYTAETLGFEKLDILSQRGIGHIKDCIELIKENKNTSLDIHCMQRIKNDDKVKKQLFKGETIGCFYIESPAMRGLLKKLQCDSYQTLVAASSIIRPGVAKSGMMREYIKRYHNPTGFDYLHPIMKSQLSETFGVMVYQEDVLKICHHFGGLDLSDADVLRRYMSGKKRDAQQLRTIREAFFNNCERKSYPSDLVSEVWRQIESFAGYAFSKAHSASYAVESFQSLYLKSHFPLEFMVAVINNFGGFYHSSVYFNEAKRNGGKIELPCVNHSDFFTNIKGQKIFMGFVHIKNLDQKTSEKIVRYREDGLYVDLNDFLNRVPIGSDQLRILIRSGAFRFSQKSKAALLWDMTSLSKTNSSSAENMALFPIHRQRYELPELISSSIEDAYDEIELFGFPVSLSYFDLLSRKLDQSMSANSLQEYVNQKITIIGELVTIKYVRTVKKQIMIFGTFFDYEGIFFDTVHFPQSLKVYPLRGKGMYQISGKVVEEFGFPSIEVSTCKKLDLQKDPRS